MGSGRLQLSKTSIFEDFEWEEFKLWSLQFLKASLFEDFKADFYFEDSTVKQAKAGTNIASDQCMLEEESSKGYSDECRQFIKGKDRRKSK